MNWLQELAKLSVRFFPNSLSSPTRASPLSASAIAIVFCIAALLRVPDRRKKVKDCGTTNGHIELMARTLMKDAREDLVR